MTEDLHRKFAIEANNEMWSLLEEELPGPASTAQERDHFLYRAYASAYHWMETPSGNAANLARAEHLIARAAIAAGLADVGLRHAERCLGLCEEHGDLVEDWDLAFAEEAIARAYAGKGDTEAARKHRERASVLGAAIVDDDDREVFLAELARGPWFGLE